MTRSAFYKAHSGCWGSIWKTAGFIQGRDWWFRLGLEIRVERVYRFLLANLVDDGHSLTEDILE